ncbi:MAG: phenylalanine--tRNA ligase subunit beta [Armatimonadetes bacterium]|nr:phenylalanine--tRNA ligase subunit beta [Armatimonadota bacterium]
MMRIPMAWLSEYVRTELDADQLAEMLTDLGIEIEEIEDAPGGLGGKVLVAEVTPNRGDCLSILGMAREVAARTGAELVMPDLTVPESADERIDGRVRVGIEAEDLCARYSARLVLGVTPGPSPQWMQDKLLACGQRPIDILVDVTNYVMFELGQPLHAFDYDLLGPNIGVRRAREGEILSTLDGVDRKLTPGNLLITDGANGVALAGVMGGASTAVSSTTRNVLIEAAHFTAPNIRRTARNLGLESESSYRFARVVDPGGTIRAADRCAQLLAQCAGGTVVTGVVDALVRPIEPATITLRPARCNTFLGLALTCDEMAGYLRALGMEVTIIDGLLAVEVPTYRPDVTREVDLIEEVARLHGYNNVPMTLPPAAQRTGRLSRAQKAERRIRDLCLAAGLNEVWTFSLTSPQAMARAGYNQDPAAIGAVTLENALSTDFSVMRWSMLPSMLEVVGRNMTAHGGEVRIFEVGRTYAGLDPRVTDQTAAEAGRIATGHTAASLPVPCTEERTLAGAVTGRLYSSAWNMPAEQLGADITEVKGLLDLLCGELRLAGVTAEPCDDPVFEPGRSGQLKLAGETIAVFGEVADGILDAYDIRRPVVLFEANLGRMIAASDLSRAYRPLPRYPAALRDIALVVPDEVPQAAVEAAIREVADNLAELKLFDVYRGKGLPEGQRSLAYGLTFRLPDRTLTDVEVDAAMARIVEHAQTACSAVLRA